jgi:MFS family permease
MVVGSSALSRWPFRKLGWGIAIGYVGVALTVVAMAVLRTPPLWVLCNFLAGVALPYAWIPTDTYLQVSVPDGMRGRVQSARSMVNMGAQPIGLSLGGLFIDRFGLVACFAGMGIGSALAGFVGVLDPVLRKTEVKEIDKGVPPE